MQQPTPSNSPKIAYITSRFPKLSETFILYEMVALQEMGADVSVFSLVQEKEDAVHPEAEQFLPTAHYGRESLIDLLGAQLYWLTKKPLRLLSTLFLLKIGNAPSPKFFLRALAAFPSAVYFAHIMQREKIAYIHAHWATHSALTAWVAHRLTDIPYSFTAHANDLYVDQTFLKRKIKDAAFVATISEFNREFIRNHRLADDLNRVHLVHCGVDTTFFPENLNGSRPHPPFVITCVGRLVPKKGQPYLVDACLKLAAQNIPFFCQFLGDGELLEPLKAKIKEAGLEKQIVFRGSVTRDQVLTYLQGSHVMVLPSVTTPSGRMEGIPVVLMEAMATGLPVISTRISGIPELVINEHNGLLVDEKDADQLADALMRIYHNLSWAAVLGKNGRQKVLAEFDLQRNAAKLYGLMKEHI